MDAEILTIGDELCRGEIVDTNSSYLAERLWELDITTRWMTSCNDRDGDIVAALTAATARADVVVCSGGLGPTEDDLTVDVAAELAGATVEVDPPARDRMAAWLTQLGRPVTPIQLRQVRVPSGARVFANPVGLAPGFEVTIAGRPVICLPGVPREVYALWDAHIAPRLVALRDAAGAREHVARRVFRVFGRGESQIASACNGLIDGVAGASIHYQVKFPETLVKLVVRDRELAEATSRLDELDREVRRRLAPFLYATGSEPLIERAVRRAIASHRTIATAESCTGGLIGQLITALAGSSAAYIGGAITYSNREKTRQLGVRDDTLAAHGAVSRETAIEMARGARERFAADLAIAVTGIAGPDGGTPDKPVGTVWIAVAHGDGAVATRKLSWPSTRDQIRLFAAWWALAMLDAALSDDPGEAARRTWLLEEAR